MTTRSESATYMRYLQPGCYVPGNDYDPGLMGINDNTREASSKREFNFTHDARQASKRGNFNLRIDSVGSVWTGVSLGYRALGGL